jgi:hypothetical protein
VYALLSEKKWTAFVLACSFLCVGFSVFLVMEMGLGFKCGKVTLID